MLDVHPGSQPSNMGWGPRLLNTSIILYTDKLHNIYNIFIFELNIYRRLKTVLTKQILYRPKFYTLNSYTSEDTKHIMTHNEMG